MSAPELRTQQAIAAVLRLVHQAAALQARVLIPGPDGEAETLVALEPHGPLLIERPTGTVEVPHDRIPEEAEPDVPMPPTPELQPYSAFEVSEDGTVSGMIGALPALAEAMARLAGAIGGDAIVACDLRTTEPERPLGLVARGSEPVVALIGDDAFEIPR